MTNAATTTSRSRTTQTIGVDVTPELEAFRAAMLAEWGDVALDVHFSTRHWSLDLPADSTTHDTVRVSVDYYDEQVIVYGMSGYCTAWHVEFSLSTPFAVVVATVHEACGLNN